jgi:hypothetical protein
VGRRSKMETTSRQVTIQRIGETAVPVVIVDDFYPDVDTLSRNLKLSEFLAQPNNYYPGVRCGAPLEYQVYLRDEVSRVIADNEVSFLSQENAEELITGIRFSAFSLNTLAAVDLKPIQMLPHFDTPKSDQLAVVHYLCDGSHGGTSFYRHRTTGYCQINESVLAEYGQLLKQQAIKSKLHLSPSYINGDTDLFERVLSVPAKFNRAIIYPSNLLHSGNITEGHDTQNDLTNGRLTVGTFLQLSC